MKKIYELINFQYTHFLKLNSVQCGKFNDINALIFH